MQNPYVFSHCFILLSFTNGWCWWHRVDHSLGTLTSIEAALSQMNSAYLASGNFVLSPQAQEKGSIPPSSVPSPSAAQIKFRRWPQPAGWINPWDSSLFSSGSFSLTFSVPFGESFTSCSPDPFLVVFSCRQPQQTPRNCRCFSSSSVAEQRN